jgi:branched-chain amino acid transport system permease protein
MDLPAGVRNFTYNQDMAIFRTKTHWAMLVGLFVILLAAPLFLGNYHLNIINLILITIIAATGLNILTGYCGQLSIGHAGFIAVGAYTSAILTVRFDMPFLVGLLAGGLMAGLVGIIFGLPSLRVKGFYLAISTIAAQYIIKWVLDHWTSATGGFNGMSVPQAEIFGFTFGSKASQFYLVLGIAVIAIYAAKNLARTRVGRAFVAIRDNDLAAEVMGINLFSYKLLAFFIGCFFAGIAGALLGHVYYNFISTESFSFNDSVLYIGMIIIGGMGSTVGPIFGVIFIRLLQVVVTNLSPAVQSAMPFLPSGFTAGLAPMLFGIIIIVFLIFEPRGLAHRWELFKKSYRIWPFSY